MLDDSVQPISRCASMWMTRASSEATRVLGLVTDTFYVPLDAHRVLVANDTRDNREQYHAPGGGDGVSAGAERRRDDRSAATWPRTSLACSRSGRSARRAPSPCARRQDTLAAFNATMRDLLEGRSQVVLDVRMIQVAHNVTRNTGAQLPQTDHGLQRVCRRAIDPERRTRAWCSRSFRRGWRRRTIPLAILGILLASGQVSSSLFSNGFALFGGGLTDSALSPGASTINLNLNTSDSRELDQIQLRLGDGEEGTLKEGERYPIQTSSFSSLSPSLPNIPGLTGAGSFEQPLFPALFAASTVPNIPMVQYQDLGLTLKATPKVMRNGDVALTLDMKLDALSGSSIDGNPILEQPGLSPAWSR